MKKYPWSANYIRNFQLALIISLGMVIAAFEWTTHIEAPLYPSFEALEDEGDIEIVRTVFPKKKKHIIPPVKIKITPDVDLPDEPEFIEKIEPVPDRAQPVPDEFVVNSMHQIPMHTASAPKLIPPPPPPPRNTIDCDLRTFVEHMPIFGHCKELKIYKDRRSCSDRELLGYISEHIRYPNLARQNGIEGLVVVSFVVETDGSVSTIKVLRDIGGDCGEEAKRIVSRMPKWSPGRHNGKAVRVQFNLPVRFKLQK